jgi:hypothetical protein
VGRHKLKSYRLCARLGVLLNAFMRLSFRPKAGSLVPGLSRRMRQSSLQRSQISTHKVLPKEAFASAIGFYRRSLVDRTDPLGERRPHSPGNRTLTD